MRHRLPKGVHVLGDASDLRMVAVGSDGTPLALVPLTAAVDRDELADLLEELLDTAEPAERPWEAGRGVATTPPADPSPLPPHPPLGQPRTCVTVGASGVPIEPAAEDLLDLSAWRRLLRSHGRVVAGWPRRCIDCGAEFRGPKRNVLRCPTCRAERRNRR